MFDKSPRVVPVLGKHRALTQFPFGQPARCGREIKTRRRYLRKQMGIQSRSVLDRLLHSAADGVIVVLRFDQSDGNIRFVVKNVVGSLSFTPRNQLVANDNPSSREEDLFTNLRLDIPTRLHDGGRDELRANIAFGEVFPDARTELGQNFS